MSDMSDGSQGVPSRHLTDNFKTTAEGRRYRELVAKDLSRIEEQMAALDRSMLKSQAQRSQHAALNQQRNSRLAQQEQIDRQLRKVTQFQEWNHEEWVRTNLAALNAIAGIGAGRAMIGQLGPKQASTPIARGAKVNHEPTVTPSQLRRQSMQPQAETAPASVQNKGNARPSEPKKEQSLVATDKVVMRSPSESMGVEPASPELLTAIGKKRALTIAKPGSEELRMLDYFGAEASVGGVNNSSILLRENPSKAAALEEFLHGTQSRLGVVDRLGTSGLGSAETHVKDFMIRHRNMLGLSAEDVRILQILRDKGL